MNGVGLGIYRPTNHAIDRASTRFGIQADQVMDWANAQIRRAKSSFKSGPNSKTYVTREAKIVVDTVRDMIITVYPTLSTDFLRPTLERELRRLKRYYTPLIRQKEVEYAEKLKRHANLAMNFARARNPKTRAIIEERMTAVAEDSRAAKRDIERLKDEWQAKERAIEAISG